MGVQSCYPQILKKYIFQIKSILRVKVKLRFLHERDITCLRYELIIVNIRL